jgi:hypothetical protein
LLGGRTEDQRGVRVLRARGGEAGLELEVGEVRPLEEGKPIDGDVVRLKPRAGSPAVCDVDTLVRMPRRAWKTDDVETRRRTTRTGPVQVATDRYRANWDAIWPDRSPGSSGLN